MTDSAQPLFDPDASYPPRDGRIHLQRKISLKFKEFRGFVTEFSDNLSLGGMFIRTTTPAPIGTVFDFEFCLEEGEPLIHGIGQVIWVRERDEGFDHPAGIGVRFLFVDPEGRQLIERMVADRLAGGAPITEIELGPAVRHTMPLPAPTPTPDPFQPPSLGRLDVPEADEAPAPWSLEAPPIDPPSGSLGPLMPTRRPEGGRGGAARPERKKRAAWQLAALLFGLAALAALAWYGASLLGLVGDKEPETVPLRVSPIPAPATSAPATAPPPTLAADAPPPEPSRPEPSATQIEPVAPATMPPPAPPEPDGEPADRPGRRGERHFKRIESITWESRPDGLDVILTADGKVEEWDYTLLHLTGPPRELIKIENVERGFDATQLDTGSPDVPRIRVGFHSTPGGNELHVVLDLATPSVRVEHTNADGRQIRLRVVGPR
ncbi:MAG: TIGR02266 family protein [Thermoanaerobaculia bacterium]|nr:TIGR02266 family protein [Thermoanaerobaculia bacterium]